MKKQQRKKKIKHNFLQINFTDKQDGMVAIRQDSSKLLPSKSVRLAYSLLLCSEGLSWSRFATLQDFRDSKFGSRDRKRPQSIAKHITNFFIYLPLELDLETKLLVKF